MSRKSKIQVQIAELQAELAILNAAPSDTYPFGTVVVFAVANPVSKTHYVKVGEELWKKIGYSSLEDEKDLASFILEYKLANVGYFEVYVLVTQASPIYASS